MPSLLALLSGLNPDELGVLAERHGGEIDEQLRVPPHVQVARLMVDAVARTAGSVRRRMQDALGGHARAREELQTAGIGWPTRNGEWEVPWAFELLLGPANTASPRSFLELYTRIEHEAARTIARGRGFPWLQAPRALALESLWGALRTPADVARELSTLAPAELEVLVRVAEEGGEVSGHELADLERNPSRVATTSGLWSRRGASFSLARRGLLLPLSGDFHVVPDEVERALSPASHNERLRAATHAQLALAAPVEAIRAQYTMHPGYVLGAVVLLALSSRASKAPRVLAASRAMSIAARLDTSRDSVALLYGLAFDAGWLRASVGPTLADAQPALMSLWLRSSLWDETYAEPDLRRSAEGASQDGIVQGLRELLVEQVQRAAAGRWVSVDAIARATLSDPRATRLSRALLRRSRQGSVSLEQACVSMLAGALHALGEVDIADGAEGRLCRRAARHAPAAYVASDDERRIRLAEPLRLSDLARIADLVEPVSWTGELWVTLTEEQVQEAFVRGETAESVSARLRGPLGTSGTWQTVVRRGMTPRAIASASRVARVLHVAESELLENLYADAKIAPLLVEGAPKGWLFVRDETGAEQVIKELRTRGVRVDMV